MEINIEELWLGFGQDYGPRDMERLKQWDERSHAINETIGDFYPCRKSEQGKPRGTFSSVQYLEAIGLRQHIATAMLHRFVAGTMKTHGYNPYAGTGKDVPEFSSESLLDVRKNVEIFAQDLMEAKQADPLILACALQHCARELVMMHFPDSDSFERDEATDDEN